MVIVVSGIAGFSVQCIAGVLSAQSSRAYVHSLWVVQEQQEWRRKREEESLKNSVLDSTAAARFSTAAALEAAKEKGIAGRLSPWNLLPRALRDLL